MKHLLFLDTNAHGAQAISVFGRRGYDVTVLRSEAHKKNSSTDDVLKVSEVFQVLSVENVLKEKSIELIREINSKKRIDCIVALLDDVTPAASLFAEFLNIPFLSRQSVEFCKDKFQTRSLLEKFGLTKCKFFRIVTEGDIPKAIAHVGFPAVFKPVDGSGSLFAKVLFTHDDLNTAYQQYRNNGQCSDVILETYLSGTMLSVEIAISKDLEMWVMAVGERKRWNENDIVELGTNIPPISVDRKKTLEVAEYAKDVSTVLGLRQGIFHLEIMVTVNGIELIEANCRLMGGSGPILLTEILREDIFEILLDIYEGKSLLGRVDLSFHGAVASRALGASSLTCAGESVRDVSWVSSFLGEKLISIKIDVSPGDVVPRVQSNFDYIGNFQVRDVSAQASYLTAERLLQELSKRTKIPLAGV